MLGEERCHQLPLLSSRWSSEDVTLTFEEVRVGRRSILGHSCHQPPSHVGVPGSVVRALGDEHGIRNQGRAQRGSRPGSLMRPAPGPCRAGSSTGPRLPGLEVRYDEGGPRSIWWRVDRDGIGPLSAAVLCQELGEQQGMFSTAGDAEQAHPAPERRHLSPHGFQCVLPCRQTMPPRGVPGGQYMFSPVDDAPWRMLGDMRNRPYLQAMSANQPPAPRPANPPPAPST